jgi:hypothetical protein
MPSANAEHLAAETFHVSLPLLLRIRVASHYLTVVPLLVVVVLLFVVEATLFSRLASAVVTLTSVVEFVWFTRRHLSQGSDWVRVTDSGIEAVLIGQGAWIPAEEIYMAWLKPSPGRHGEQAHRVSCRIHIKWSTLPP